MYVFKQCSFSQGLFHYFRIFPGFFSQSPASEGTPTVRSPSRVILWPLWPSNTEPQSEMPFSSKNLVRGFHLLLFFRRPFCVADISFHVLAFTDTFRNGRLIIPASTSPTSPPVGMMVWPFALSYTLTSRRKFLTTN